MENGSISDVGSHQELLQRFGTYQRLYNLQFVEIDPVEAVK